MSHLQHGPVAAILQVTVEEHFGKLFKVPIELVLWEGDVMMVERNATVFGIATNKDDFASIQKLGG